MPKAKKMLKRQLPHSFAKEASYEDMQDFVASQASQKRQRMLQPKIQDPEPLHMDDGGIDGDEDDADTEDMNSHENDDDDEELAYVPEFTPPPDNYDYMF